MEKLELKHLAPYLPYKLRVMHGENNKVMNTGKGSSKHWIGISSVIRWQNVKAGCKPILNPLTERIIREKIYPSVNVKEIVIQVFSIVVIWEAMGETMKTWIKASGSFDGCPTWIMNKLYENHVDAFGLINNGLAISSENI